MKKDFVYFLNKYCDGEILTIENIEKEIKEIEAKIHDPCIEDVLIYRHTVLKARYDDIDKKCRALNDVFNTENMNIDTRIAIGSFRANTQLLKHIIEKFMEMIDEHYKFKEINKRKRFHIEYLIGKWNHVRIGWVEDYEE